MPMKKKKDKSREQEGKRHRGGTEVMIYGKMRCEAGKEIITGILIYTDLLLTITLVKSCYGKRRVRFPKRRLIEL